MAGPQPKFLTSIPSLGFHGCTELMLQAIHSQTPSVFHFLPDKGHLHLPTSHIIVIKAGAHVFPLLLLLPDQPWCIPMGLAWRGVFPPLGNSELYTLCSKAIVPMSVIVPYLIKPSPESILKQLYSIVDPQSLCDFDVRVQKPANDVNSQPCLTCKQWMLHMTQLISWSSQLYEIGAIITPILYVSKDSEKVSKELRMTQMVGTELRRGLVPVAGGLMLCLDDTYSYLTLTCYAFSYFSLWLSHSHEHRQTFSEGQRHALQYSKHQECLTMRKLSPMFREYNENITAKDSFH